MKERYSDKLLLMDKINKNFEQFYEKIQLTDEQKEDAKCKYKGVCKVLHNHYYPSVKYDGTTKLLFGSYGKKTHIRPARDIDVIFRLPLELFEQYHDNQSNKQAQLLQDVRNVLKRAYPKSEINANEKVVTVHFSERRHNVEVLPAWEEKDNKFRIPDSTDGGKWKYDFDPRLEMKKIQDSEEQTGNTRFLIRVIKKWSENCSANIKSYDIEQKVLNFFMFQRGERKSELVGDFFQFAYNNETQDNLKSHFNTACKRAKKAFDLETAGDFESASIEWKKVFGNDFLKLENTDKKNTVPSSAPRSINPAIATQPYYYRCNDSREQENYQITEQDLVYIKNRYVKSIRHKFYFLLKNHCNNKKILKKNYFHINLPFELEYKGKIIKGSYCLKIDFNRMDGGVLPQVFDIKNRIKKVAERNNLKLEDMHVYENNMRLCLTLPSFVKEKKMQNGFDFKIFFENVLEEVLYWHAYYEKYGREPWKALSHGDKGVEEFIERYNPGNRRDRRKNLSNRKKNK